jgi:hypothetical protein
MSEVQDTAARRRAQTVARLRALGSSSAVRQAPGEGGSSVERCDLCHTSLPDDHRHLLHLVERRILCSCEACWALHSGDAEYRPAGMRTVWLESFQFDEELWRRFAIPIGLAFFMRSSVTNGVVAFYPSPAGATESELSLEAWELLVARNPALEELDPDAEALIVNRLSSPPQYVIAPIDQCYALVGLIKSRWDGISGGSALEQAVPDFFEGLRRRAGSARPPARAGGGEPPVPAARGRVSEDAR